MISRATAALALVSLVAGCGAAQGTTSEPGEPTGTAGTQSAGTARPRTDIEAALDCYLTTNPDYSRGRGTTQEAAVSDLAGWYPPITRTIRWQDPGASAPSEGGATTWLLYGKDGGGCGTASVSQPDPGVEEWAAGVDRLWVAALAPPPNAYTDRTQDGLSGPDSLADPANSEFVQAMESAIVGLAGGTPLTHSGQPGGAFASASGTVCRGAASARPARGSTWRSPTAPSPDSPSDSRRPPTHGATRLSPTPPW